MDKIISLNEGLTQSELDAREEIFKNLKHNKAGFVKRYGKEAEKVMYATATKQAKNKVEKTGKERIREMIKSILRPNND